MAEIKPQGYMAQILKSGNKQGTSVFEKYYTSRLDFNKTNKSHTIFPSFEINNLYSYQAIILVLEKEIVLKSRHTHTCTSQYHPKLL